MTTAYDITHRIRVLVAALEASGGEADEATEDALGELVEAAQGKADALLYTLERLDLETTAERVAEQRHARRRATLGKADERVRALLRELVLGHLEITGESKLRTPHGTAYLSVSTAVEGPENPEEWPDEYLVVIEDVRVNKRQALEDLRAGRQVPGVRLAERVSLGVRRG